MGRLLRAILASSCLIGISSPLVVAQEPTTSEAAETTFETQVIEEITVLGERSFFTLRLEVESAEEEVFGIFNELNSSDEMDIECTREVYTGSHLPKRVCMTGFLREAIARNTQDYLKGIDVQLTGAQVRGEVRQKSIALEAEMTRLAQENPALFEALQKLVNLAGALEAKKAQGFSFFK